MGFVELRVSEDGEEILVYALKDLAKAAEMIDFLSEFLPDAQYLVQPGRH